MPATKYSRGSPNRLPCAPPASSSAAADIAIPTQYVCTSGFTYCMAS